MADAESDLHVAIVIEDLDWGIEKSVYEMTSVQLRLNNPLRERPITEINIAAYKKRDDP